MTEALDAVLAEMRAGRTIRAWAAALGVSYNTPHKWIRRERPCRPTGRGLVALLREATPEQREVLLRELDPTVDPAAVEARAPVSFETAFD